MDLMKAPPEGERNFILKHAYGVIPDSVPPIVIYGVLVVVGFVMIRGALK